MQTNPSRLGRPQTISLGHVFIKSDTRLPQCFQFRFEEHGDWKRLLDINSEELEILARRAGWSFSYIQPAVKCRAFNMGKHRAMNHALQKAAEVVSRSNFNSVEIIDITSRQMFSLHYAHVVVHPRQLRPHPSIRDPDPYYYPHEVWNTKRICWKAAQTQPEFKGI
jgi:hypothetical protein